jgi:hypothetical protein
MAGLPGDPEIVTEVFGPLTRELSVTRIDADPTLPDSGDSGTVLLTGVTAADLPRRLAGREARSVGHHGPSRSSGGGPSEGRLW